MTTSTDMIRGRSNVVTLTNNSGGALVAGDVCIQDTSADEKATTTTTAADTKKVFVAAEAIAGGAAGRFYESGYCPLVNVNTSVTRGHFLFTHTVAKQATGSATYAAGAFGKILKSGTTPSAIIYSQTAQVSGGGIASTRTAYGSRGSGSATGDMWMGTDCPYISRWNGSTWDTMALGFPIVEPDSTSWSWINQGTALVDTSKGFHRLYDPTGGAINYRIRQETYTSSASIIRSALIIPSTLVNVNYSAIGIGFRDSVSGKLSVIGWLMDAGGELAILHAANATSDYGTAAAVFSRGGYILTHPLWLQIEKDSTKLYFRFSADGQNYYEIYNEAKNAYLTNDPDNVFFFTEVDASTVPGIGVSLLSWG